MKGSSCGMKKGYKAGGMAKIFGGKESAKEERMEKKMSPAAYKRGEAMEKKSTSKKGGKSNMDMKAMGRNMAKMKAQGK